MFLANTNFILCLRQLPTFIKNSVYYFLCEDICYLCMNNSSFCLNSKGLLMEIKQFLFHE